MQKLYYWTLYCVLLLMPVAHAQAVTVSIKPLALIYQALLPQSAVADVILPNSQSMHDYALSVADLQKLQKADTFFWLNGANEQFLAPLAQRFASQASWYRLATEVMPGHPWLSFDSLPQLISAMANILIQRQPEQKAAILARQSQLIEQLNRLQKDWQKRFKGFEKTPFLLGHSAFAVLADSLGLHGAVFYYPSQSHDHAQSGMQTLLAVQQRIQRGEIRCAIEEQEVSFKALAARYPQLRRQYLDANADKMDLTGDALVQFMQQSTQALYQCLAGEQ